MDSQETTSYQKPSKRTVSNPDKRWSSDNHDDLLFLIEDHYKEDQRNKLALIKLWEEGIRFIEGDQYIKYNKTLHAYEPIPDRIDREYIPRANDNQLYIRADIMRSNLTRQGPIFDITPNSNDPKDERESKVALAVHDARVELDGDREVQGEMADWLVATGNAFIKTAWCPTYKIPVINEDGTPMLDENGDPVLAAMGDAEVSSRSPLCMAPDREATSDKDLRVIMEYSYQDLDDVKNWYDQKGEGYTGLASELVEGDVTDDSGSLKTNENLKDMRGQEKKDIKHRVVLKETYVAPDEEELPFGRMIISCQDKILYVNDSPYAKVDLKFWHPYKHPTYKTQPGRYWGITPITQCVKLQRRLNAIDTMIILNRQTMAMGQWLVPKNTVKNGAFSGRVGLRIEYKTGPKGEKPEKINGTSVGVDIFEERKSVIEAMDSLCGTTDILKANPPTDMTSGVSMEMIREMSFNRFNPLYERWEKTLEGAAQLRLMLISKHQIENRPEFTAIIRRKLRSLTSLDIDSFLGASLGNNTNIRIEAGSTVPKSNATTLAFMEKFGEAGLLGDVIKDPFKNQMFLSKFGIDKFKTKDNVDYENAKYQLGLIETGQGAKVMMTQFDNQDIHIAYLTSKLLDPTWYTSRPPQVVQSITQLIIKRKQAADNARAQAKVQSDQQRDESAYVQSIIDRGGPDGEVPTLSLFPSAIKAKLNDDAQKETQMQQMQFQKEQEMKRLQDSGMFAGRPAGQLFQ